MHSCQGAHGDSSACRWDILTRREICIVFDGACAIMSSIRRRPSRWAGGDRGSGGLPKVSRPISGTGFRKISSGLGIASRDPLPFLEWRSRPAQAVERSPGTGCARSRRGINGSWPNEEGSAGRYAQRGPGGAGLRLLDDGCLEGGFVVPTMRRLLPSPLVCDGECDGRWRIDGAASHDLRPLRARVDWSPPPGPNSLGVVSRTGSDLGLLRWPVA